MADAPATTVAVAAVGGVVSAAEPAPGQTEGEGQRDRGGDHAPPDTAGAASWARGHGRLQGVGHFAEVTGPWGRAGGHT